MNKVTNATKAQNTKKPLIENQNGTLVVNEQVNGKKLEKILSPLQESKKDFKKKANSVRNELATTIKILKDSCKTEEKRYLDELSKKYNVKISGKDLYKTICNPMAYAPFLTESQLVKFNDKTLNFTPSLVIEAIGKYFKANKVALPKK
jgi:hypothetical protein